MKTATLGCGRAIQTPSDFKVYAYTDQTSICMCAMASCNGIKPYCINCCPTPFSMCQDEPPVAILWRNFVDFPASIRISPVFEYCHKPLILNCHPVFSLELRHSVPDFVPQIFSIAVGSLAKPDLVWTPDPSGRARVWEITLPESVLSAECCRWC